MIPVSGSLVLVLVAVAGFLAYTWATLPDRERTDRLYAIAAREEATAAIPATRLAQLDWLVRHRLRRLARWRTVLGAALLAAGTEGWLWHRRQTFRGYHRLLWLAGGVALLLLVGTIALFALAPRVVPTAGILSALLGLMIASGFALTAGFPAVR